MTPKTQSERPTGVEDHRKKGIPSPLGPHMFPGGRDLKPEQRRLCAFLPTEGALSLILQEAKSWATEARTARCARAILLCFIRGKGVGTSTSPGFWRDSLRRLPMGGCWLADPTSFTPERRAARFRARGVSWVGAYTSVPNGHMLAGAHLHSMRAHMQTTSRHPAMHCTHSHVTCVCTSFHTLGAVAPVNAVLSLGRAMSRL